MVGVAVERATSASREPAGAIPRIYPAAHLGRQLVGRIAEVDGLAGRRVEKQAAEPHVARGDASSQACGDRAVAIQVAGLLATEKRRERDQQQRGGSLRLTCRRRGLVRLSRGL